MALWLLVAHARWVKMSRPTISNVKITFPGEGSQQALILDAQERIRDAKRLKRRKPQGVGRNIHMRPS